MNFGRRLFSGMLGAFAGVGLTHFYETTIRPGEPPCPGCRAGDVDQRLSHTTKTFAHGRELTSYHFKPVCGVCGKPANANPDPEPWAWVPIARAELALADALRSRNPQHIFDAMMQLRDATGGGEDYVNRSEGI